MVPEVEDVGEVESFSTMVKDATVEVRKGFIRKVYSILTVQLLLTVIVAAPLTSMVSQSWLVANSWIMYLSLGMTMVTMCAMVCCQNLTRSFPTNYILLFVFTAFEGVCVGFVSAQYTWQSVVLALGMTVLIFLCMTIFAWKSKTDFTGFGPYLFAALMVLMVFGFVVSLLAMSGVQVYWAFMAYNLIGVIIFTFYIVYDTQLIIGEWGGHKHQFGIDDYVFAALNLYLDIINLFLFLLRLFGNRR
uniref:Uncharacterized protein n=1 Tax=Noctiluca scintillans TaxID=2966 RepID=A0A7S0ZZG0_NOCSC|mmetsp:Transcript_25325/g.66364  ORF Transcript_25325/g.66364 Transcript_25325/m.66364 type:complete len:246 (+) Transcript_25325:97-834(+)